MLDTLNIADDPLAELPGADDAVTLPEFAQIVREAINQPPWRATADKEADYADGNQLDSELLQRQQQIGIPPAKENIIAPAIRAVCGYEAKTRTDWRVTPDGDPAGQDVADALNFRLNQAERHSHADRALSDAFKSAATVGLGWVEVTRAANALQFPYRCRAIHRNEIWWDMQSKEPDLDDARWLFRRRWIDREQAARMFPQHATIILNNPESWVADMAGEMLEGGQSTGLAQAMDAERAWTVQEDSWYNTESRQVCVTELWYRRWTDVAILRTKNGRAVEYDAANPLHEAVLAAGHATLVTQVVPRVRHAYFVGPHRLYDGPTPHPHGNFPYVPVWGQREDMTGVPYGLVRDMLFPQDNLNASISKLRWGISSMRTERTKGAVAMPDALFRRMVARVDADVILDPQHMAIPGARFEVKRDFQLNDQQLRLMDDSRRAMERVSGITSSFMGQTGNATSGLQEQTQLEQSQVAIADLVDNFKEARRQVGDMLMALIIRDLGEDEQTIVIEGDVLNPPRSVVLNHPETDPATGVLYLSNDVQRTRLLVALEDVPSSSSFRAQQLSSLSEAVKSLPPEMQLVVMPFMIDLMDLPRKKQIVEALRESSGQPNPETLRAQIKQELMFELKERELALREREVAAREKLVQAQTVQTGVTSAFAAMQAGEKIAMNPLIAPIGDVVMQQAGWQAPTPAGQDPNYPIPEQAVPVEQPGGMPGDTSPTTPANPMQPMSASEGSEEGIETLRAD